MINFAIFGLGGIGAFHRASVLRQEAAGRARLLAIADPAADHLPDVKAGLEARGVRIYPDYRDLFREEAQLHAVVIATPIPFHYEMAQAAMDRGVWINLEKPPVPLLCQLEALIDTPGSDRVSVGFQMIGSPCIQALKQLIMDGKIGAVREIRAAGCWPRLDHYYSRGRWAGKLAMDGKPILDGPVTNAMAHVVNNIMFLAAEGRDDFAIPAEVQGECYRARPIESYDAACLRGRFSSGIDFSFAATHATQLPLPYQIEVRGAHGWARITEDGGRLESSCGIALHAPENTQQLLDRDHDHLMDVIEGRAARFRTRLPDARGYVSTANAMFISSAGIHDIDPAFITPFKDESAGGGFDVAGLREAVLESFRTGNLFSEQNLPWAVAKAASVPIDPAALIERIAGLIPAPHASPASPA